MTTEQTIVDNNQLQTNLAMEVLDRFLYLKARSFIGIDRKDLQKLMGDAKFVVQKFELSSDSKVCPYLTELIMKIMFYYELFVQCLDLLVSPHNSLGDIVFDHFPEMSTSIIHGNYDNKEVCSACLREAEKLTLELHEILNKPVDFISLQNKKLKPLTSRLSKQPKYNKNYVAILAILVGYFGVHKFVIGYTKEGLIILGILFLSGGMATLPLWLIGIIEGVIYLNKSTKDFEKTYVSGKRGWF